MQNNAHNKVRVYPITSVVFNIWRSNTATVIERILFISCTIYNNYALLYLLYRINIILQVTNLLLFFYASSRFTYCQIKYVDNNKSQELNTNTQ